MRRIKRVGYICSVFFLMCIGVSFTGFAQTENDTYQSTEELLMEEESSQQEENELLVPPVRALPQIPGDSEVLTNVFRNPIGTGPSLLTNKILQITPAKNGQRGAIWSKNKINLKRNFSLKAYLYLGDSKAKAADGITFTLQNDGRMITGPDSVIGDGGMGIGVYSNNSGGDYVRNAISIEFDTYYNGGKGDQMDKEIGANSKKGHIAFVTPSYNNNYASGEHSGITKPSDYLSNGKWRKIVIDWDAKKKVLSYDVENAGSGSHTISNMDSQFGGEEVYWGFTASTGAYNAENDIAISELPQNFEQEPTVENKTQGVPKAERVIGIKDDEIELASKVIRSPFADVELYDNSSFHVHIADGLTPKQDEVRINGTLIDTNRIEFANHLLKVKGVNLSKSGTDTVSVLCDVTSNAEIVSLENNFELVTATKNIVSTSTSVFVDIPKKEFGKVIVRYIEKIGGSEVDLKPQKEIEKKVGEAYEAVKLVIPEYEWVSTTGAPKGHITKKTQYVTFIYEPLGEIEITSFPKMIDFGEILVPEYQKKVSADKTNLDRPLIVEDTRKRKAKWDVTATVTQELTNDSNPSNIDVQKGALRYCYNGHEFTLNDEAKSIYADAATTTNKVFNISDTWGKEDQGEGLKLKIDSGRVPNTTGSYVGKITWTLRDTLE